MDVNFEQFAIENKDAVYRQMLRVCGNREDAEDALMEALQKAYQNLGQLQEEAAFRAWLAQIARRVCWQLRNRGAMLPLLRLTALEEQGHEVAAPAPGPELELAMREMRSLLKLTIAALPDEFREVYELRDLQELPGEEVAQRLGITVAAMKSRLHRARALLRDNLDEQLTTRH